MITRPATTARRRTRHRRPAGRRQPVSQGMIIPFDYAASFSISGRPGNIVQDVINIGAEGKFVATGIGYGFEQERFQAVELEQDVIDAAGAGTFVPGDISLEQIGLPALIDGIRLTPPVAANVLAQPRAIEERNELLQFYARPSPLSFLFSIVDSGTGRELQDEPAHNLASLGAGDGERPFRELPKPMSFTPRSTIRVQVIENSEGTTGRLFIVLYGYKIVAQSGCPEPVMRNLRGTAACPTETVAMPTDRVIPFDYVASLQLRGEPGRRLETEVNVNAEDGFVATHLGYGLDIAEQRLLRRRDEPAGGILNLRELTLNDFELDALRDGIRLSPTYLRAAVPNGIALNNGLPFGLAGEIFESLNCTDYLSFRYSLSDSGTGRNLQNGLIHNIAGLGAANGDRPFKQFARPMIFQPRSAIQLTVRERDGRGRLFFVFQGYKVLKKLPTRRGAR